MELFDTYEFLSASKKREPRRSYDGPEITVAQVYGTTNPIYVAEVGCKRLQDWLDCHKSDLKLLQRTDRGKWRKEWGRKMVTFSEPIKGMVDQS